MDERQLLGGLIRCGGGLSHEPSYGGVSQQQGIELLFGQFRTLAAQDQVAVGQMHLECKRQVNPIPGICLK